jgi:hypothetical protein
MYYIVKFKVRSGEVRSSVVFADDIDEASEITCEALIEMGYAIKSFIGASVYKGSEAK